MTDIERWFLFCSAMAWVLVGADAYCGKPKTAIRLLWATTCLCFAGSLILQGIRI